MKKPIRSRYDNRIFVERRLSNSVPVYIQQPQLVTDEEGELVAFLPGAGSIADPLDGYGTAHFFEHVPFVLARLKSHSAHGGSQNGRTNEYFTAYTFKSVKDAFGLTAKVQHRILSDPPFTPRVLRREIGVIGREYDLKVQSGSYNAWLEYRRALFGIEHPLGHYPVGEKSVIENMSLGRLEAFYKAHYHTGNLRLLCAGAYAELPESLLLDALETLYGTFPGGVASRRKLDVPLEKKGKTEICSNAAFSRDLLVYTIFGKDRLSDLDAGALGILCSILNQEQSMLFKELRQRRGWTYESNPVAWENRSHMWAVRVAFYSLRHWFPAIREIIRQALQSVTPKQVAARISLEIVYRRMQWTHPLNEVDTALISFSEKDRMYGVHEWEAVMDTVTVDQVLAMRDRLLGEQPFIFEAHAS